MDFLGELVMSIYGLFFGVCAVLLVFLIFRRIKNKKLEDFEKRDN